jgi:hypothetical protein
MQNSISIASSAMLVELSIKGWTARKLDKKVSAEVDVDKHTKTRAGNYNKNLLAGTGFLDTLIKYASNARGWHNSQTLAWSDNGLRLLPVSNFVEYKKQLGILEGNYNALVDKFIEAYPNLVSAAAFQLGNLFDRTEYPDADRIRSKFSFAYTFMPVPTSGDFRIDINEEAKNSIMESCSNAYEQRLNNAMKEAWTRLHDCLSRMSERLEVDIVDGEQKPKVFRDSLVENANEMVGLLSHFNLTNDEKLEDARRMLENRMKNVDAEVLRDNITFRQHVKQDVDSILSKFNF